MKEEMERALIFDEKDVDTSKISYGTIVTLFNQDSGALEEYSILGPWESNPSENVISYLSPFGNTLWSHKKGEDLDFIINNRRYQYTVNEIRSVSFADLAV